jgi:hypothetical protein
MGGNLEDETATLEALNLQSVENWWEVIGLELNVDDGTNHGFDGANILLGLSRIGASLLRDRRFLDTVVTLDYWNLGSTKEGREGRKEGSMSSASLCRLAG